MRFLLVQMLVEWADTKPTPLWAWLILIGLGMLFGPVLLAQTPTVTGVKLDLHRVSAPTVVVATVTVPIASVVCNLVASPVAPTTINPVSVEYDDPAVAGRVCRASVLTTLNALPASDYASRAQFTYSDGSVGGASAISNPFTRFDPVTLQGLRIVR